jgi:two-component system, OmpR family, response regulator MtrA
MKVLLADDDTFHVELTTYALRRCGIQVVPAADGQQALKRFEQERPDLVLLDVSLPKIDGYEVCRRIRGRSSTPVIMLTAHSDDDAVVRGLGSGADDYVPKPFSPRQLVARMEAALRRCRTSTLERSLGLVQVGDLEIDVDSHQVKKDGEVVALTPIEFRLLHLLAMNPGRVIPFARLLQHGWGMDSDDPSLIRSHVYQIRRKLKLPKCGPGSIRSVSGVGYSLGLDR